MQKFEITTHPSKGRDGIRSGRQNATGSFEDRDRSVRSGGQNATVLEYNQLVDHVGIHGQRRLTEALNKDSLDRQKEYPKESSSKSRERVYI
ncbi:hypothetical protein Taro_016073 [Colocasia esculenta]|uniref:Uncharacterized protein n=1 Tax=Colocasia esculenta TaxID=4460 RepID=A0A843UMV0_COLES|nr:hypothetical protein [Colocasia esculenta]